MLHSQNLFYIHILYTQKGVYSIFEYKTNFEREAFRFSMIFPPWPKTYTTLLIMSQECKKNVKSNLYKIKNKVLRLVITYHKDKVTLYE